MSLQELADRNTDLDSHRIQGYVPHAGKSISIPLISHVEGNLWQGGCVQGVKLPDDFAYVVSLYPWEQYDLGPDTVREEYKLYDSLDVSSLDELLPIAQRINEMRKEGKTLVHCQAGLNRSGLLAGLALILDGYEARDAIALLREKRCEIVLCNSAFEKFLLSYGSSLEDGDQNDSEEER